MVRATGLRGDPERFARGQALLGEPMWRPPSPKGFADDEGAWIDTMGPRLDIANNFAERVAERIDPKEVSRPPLGRSRRRNASGRRARGEPPAGPRARFHVARISTEVIMAFPHLPNSARDLVGTGSLFAWATCPNWRGPKAAILAFSSSCCVAPSTGSPWLPRLAIPTGSAYAAIAPSCSTASLRHCRSIVLRTRSGDAEPSSAVPGAAGNIVMRRRRLIASGRISTARTSWRAGSPSQAQPTAAGSTARSPRSRRMDGRSTGQQSFAVGPVTPLVVRGSAPIMSWAPQRLLPASDDTQMRLLDLYRHTDADLAAVFEAGRTWPRSTRPAIEMMPPGEGEAWRPQESALRAYFAESRARPRRIWRTHGPRWACDSSSAGTPTQ